MIEPESILAHRMVKKGNQAHAEVLIKWKLLPKDEATWESYQDLIRRFPNFDIETRSISGGSIDTISGEA